MAAKKKLITVKLADQGKRLDIFLLEKLKISRSQSQKIIKQGGVEVNGEESKKMGLKLKAGNKIKLKLNLKDGLDLVDGGEVINQDLLDQVRVIADEADYLVVEKPTGLITHSSNLKEKTSLSHWVLAKYPEIKGVGEYPDRPGIVHRLDRETSGLLVIAKNQRMFDSLKNQFQSREVEKYYWTLVFGKVEKDRGLIDFPIDRGSEGKMVSRPRHDQVNLKNVRQLQPGKEALTEFWVERRLVNSTLLKIRLHTGRTHQIRVHLFAYNHPVVGDKLYYNKKYKTKLDRVFLHSFKLCFKDLAGERKCYTKDLPAELVEYLEKAK